MASGELVASLTEVIDQLRADPETDCTPAAEALEQAVDEIEGLSTAVERRTVLGQATGLLMAAHSLSADQAWYVLTTYSQTTNRKVHEIAVDVVSQHDQRAAAETPDADAPATPLGPAEGREG
jgi:AmiR/NasT family two-component response regulator